MVSYISGVPGGSDGKESACNAGNLGWISGLGRSPGEGNGYPLSVFAWRIPWPLLTSHPVKPYGPRKQKLLCSKEIKISQSHSGSQINTE